MTTVQMRAQVDRWWPVLVAIPLVWLIPIAGLVWAGVMTFTQREDLPVYRVLVVITMVALVLALLPVLVRQ